MQALIVVIIILAAVILFITEKIPLALTGIGVIIALILTGILTAKEAFAGFSNETTLLILFMAPIGEALFKTGVGEYIGDKMIRIAKNNEKKIVLSIMLCGLVLSSISSNTGTFLALMPLVLGIGVASGIPAGRLLIPLAFSTSFGGILTLIGTAPNIMINAAAKAYGVKTFGFFEFGKVGIFVAVSCTIYMILLGIKQLPKTNFKNCELSNNNNIKSNMNNGKNKKWISMLIMCIIIISMTMIDYIEAATGLTLPAIAVIGAMLVVITGCINMKEFFDSVNWTAVMLFAALIPLGTAMTKTGAAELIAGKIVNYMPLHNKYVLISVLFLIAGTLAQFMSHTAATAILSPVFFSISVKTGVNPQALLMTLAISTGIAVATPIGTPPNVIAYSNCDYKFTDFIKTGIPVFFISWIISVIFIPIFFPL